MSLKDVILQVIIQQIRSAFAGGEFLRTDIDLDLKKRKFIDIR
jgi:DNA-binding NarL/FixJ family response regulator